MTTERRDRLGRRIGRNWWREYVCGLLSSADHAWFLKAEEETLGYPTELEDYRKANPRPQLKVFLVELAGTCRGET